MKTNTLRGNCHGEVHRNAVNDKLHLSGLLQVYDFTSIPILKQLAAILNRFK